MNQSNQGISPKVFWHSDFFVFIWACLSCNTCLYTQTHNTNETWREQLSLGFRLIGNRSKVSSMNLRIWAWLNVRQMYYLLFGANDAILKIEENIVQNDILALLYFSEFDFFRVIKLTKLPREIIYGSERLQVRMSQCTNFGNHSSCVGRRQFKRTDFFQSRTNLFIGKRALSSYFTK